LLQSVEVLLMRKHLRPTRNAPLQHQQISADHPPSKRRLSNHALPSRDPRSCTIYVCLGRLSGSRSEMSHIQLRFKQPSFYQFTAFAFLLRRSERCILTLLLHSTKRQYAQIQNFIHFYTHSPVSYGPTTVSARAGNSGLRLLCLS
jgi:hypothetical protein